MSSIEKVKSLRPVLITGAYRSGTTYTGAVMSHAKDFGYIFEPFNLRTGHGFYGERPPFWATYICKKNEEQYIEPLSKVLNFEFNWRLETLKNPNSLESINQQKILCEQYSIKRKRPLMKDPFAFFSTEWLVDTFGMSPVILIRHPAAFAYSVKRLGWRKSFLDLLGQNLLMTDHLHPFEAEMQDEVVKPGDLLEHAILTWRLIYSVAAKFRAMHPDWLFVRHEDLSKLPETGFSSIFKTLSVPLTPSVLEAIRYYSGEQNPVDPPENQIHFLTRNSKENTLTWKRNLNPSEIFKIRKGTEDISTRFYRDDDW